MAIHIKNRWHNDNTEHSVSEIASALAFNAWRIAKDKSINLHSEHFIYHNDQQRMAVLAEYLFFQIHIIDRIAYESLNTTERHALIVQLITKLAELIHDNSVDLFGPGEHGHFFINSVNERSAEYAEFNFTADGISYPALRHLGYHIQQIMGKHEENRWVIDQVMDKDGYEVYQQIAHTVNGLIQ